MNRIIRENYPASKLPTDLREGIDPAANVTVTVVEEPHALRPPTLEDILAQRRPPYRTAAEIDEDLRRDRDESDG